MSIQISNLSTVSPSFAYFVAKEISLDSLTKKDIIKCLKALGVKKSEILRLKFKQELWGQLQIASVPKIGLTRSSDTRVNKKFDSNDLSSDLNIEQFDIEEFFAIATNPIVLSQTSKKKGINTIINYIYNVNANNFESAVNLFSPNGALQPPFDKAIIGREAIASYLKEKLFYLKIIPESGIIESIEEGYTTIKVRGKIQNFSFGSSVRVNITWRFLLDPPDQIISKWEFVSFSNFLPKNYFCQN